MRKQTTQRIVDVPHQSGAGAIGARLRQLSYRVDREASAVYNDIGVAFDQRAFGVMNQLADGVPLGVSELALRLGITHPAVSQIWRKLESARLIEARAERDDARRTVLALTPKGRRFIVKARPIWSALEATSRELDREAGGLVACLDRLEAALDRCSIGERVARLSEPRATTDESVQGASDGEVDSE